jgi:hypothetical protein
MDGLVIQQRRKLGDRFSQDLLNGDQVPIYWVFVAPRLSPTIG